MFAMQFSCEQTEKETFLRHNHSMITMKANIILYLVYSVLHFGKSCPVFTTLEEGLDGFLKKSHFRFELECISSINL